MLEKVVIPKNEPYSGQYTARITSEIGKITGTNLKPNEKVFLLLETLKNETEVAPFKSWTIGVVKNKNPENTPTCVPLNLLNMNKNLKAEISAAKRRLEQS